MPTNKHIDDLLLDLFIFQMEAVNAGNRISRIAWRVRAKSKLRDARAMALHYGEQEKGELVLAGETFAISVGVASPHNSRFWVFDRQHDLDQRS